MNNHSLQDQWSAIEILFFCEQYLDFSQVLQKMIVLLNLSYSFDAYAIYSRLCYGFLVYFYFQSVMGRAIGIMMLRCFSTFFIGCWCNLVIRISASFMMFAAIIEIFFVILLFLSIFLNLTCHSSFYLASGTEYLVNK